MSYFSKNLRDPADGARAMEFHVIRKFSRSRDAVYSFTQAFTEKVIQKYIHLYQRDPENPDVNDPKFPDFQLHTLEQRNYEFQYEDSFKWYYRMEPMVDHAEEFFQDRIINKLLTNEVRIWIDARDRDQLATFKMDNATGRILKLS